MKEKLLLRVGKTYVLTGLGILLFPDGPAALLTTFGLHETLALTLRYPAGFDAAAVASVEEIASPDAAATRALLLTPAATSSARMSVPPVGTEVWWVEAAPPAA